MAWFVIPAPGGAGVIARAYTEARNGGQVLPGHLAASDLAALQTIMPPDLTLDPLPVVGSRTTKRWQYCSRIYLRSNKCFDAKTSFTGTPFCIQRCPPRRRENTDAGCLFIGCSWITRQ